MLPVLCPSDGFLLVSPTRQCKCARKSGLWAVTWAPNPVLCVTPGRHPGKKALHIRRGTTQLQNINSRHLFLIC